MFGASNGNKLKFKRAKNKRKRRESFNQSANYSQRSARDHVNALPEVGSSIGVNTVKTNHSRSQQRKSYAIRPEYSDQTITLCEIYSEGKKSLFTIDNSSSNDGSKKTNKKDLLSNHKSSLYQDRTIENLRNIYKAEKELRGIFQAVKVYEFPILKDEQGNISIIGKYEPKKLKKSNLCPFRPPSRLSINPIVFDKAFGGIQADGTGGDGPIKVQKIDDTQKMPLDAANLELLAASQQKTTTTAASYVTEGSQQQLKTQIKDGNYCKTGETCDDANDQANNISNNQNWDISTIASSSGFSTNKKVKIQISSSSSIQTLKNLEQQQISVVQSASTNKTIETATTAESNDGSSQQHKVTSTSADKRKGASTLTYLNIVNTSESPVTKETEFYSDSIYSL